MVFAAGGYSDNSDEAASKADLARAYTKPTQIYTGHKMNARINLSSRFPEL